MIFSTSERKNKSRTGLRKPGLFKPLLIILCMISVYGAATASSAFWTDNISIDQNVKALSIGIDYSESELGLAEDEPFTPGDSKAFSFTVENSGEISVDIKPVISITASADMKSGGNGFTVVDTGGTEITGYTKTYYDEGGSLVSGEDVADGSPYRKIVYELTSEDTLSGSEQSDGDKGETDSSRLYEYKLKLNDETDNDFEGVTADIDISTYAIQHRNRDPGEGWVSIVG